MSEAEEWQNISEEKSERLKRFYAHKSGKRKWLKVDKTGYEKLANKLKRKAMEHRLKAEQLEKAAAILLGNDQPPAKGAE